MKNGEFKIDTKSGVVVFAQKAHGQIFVSTSKVDNIDKFNIGVGQLIAMKRNEITIRKQDIKGMRKVYKRLIDIRDSCGDDVTRKLYSDFARQTYEKINASLNHVRELKTDLRQLYKGEYELPLGIELGKYIYKVIDGSVKMVCVEEE